MADINVSGPLFDGKASAALDRAKVVIRHEVAAEGEKLAKTVFMGRIKVNHGHFMNEFDTVDQSKAMVSHSGKHTYTMPVTAGPDETVVTTDNATYGPWLEGTSSRNNTTRFKGYNGFKRASETLNRVADVIADDVMKFYVDEMNR